MAFEELKERQSIVLTAACMPPPPDGADNPFAWGDPDHLEALLGDTFELRYEKGDCPQPGSSADRILELFTTSYGPTKALAVSLDERRRQTLRSDGIAHFDRFRNGGGVSQPRPYLLVLGTRREES
jgi:hypothetical protein